MKINPIVCITTLFKTPFKRAPLIGATTDTTTATIANGLMVAVSLMLGSLTIGTSAEAAANKPVASLAKKVTPIADTKRSAIEAVVKDYLLKNPAIVREALQALERQEAEAKAAQITAAVAKNRDALQRNPDSPISGNPNGDVTLVEFFDYRCGFCQRVGPAIAELLERDKNVRVVYKDLPILGPDSMLAAKAAIAANKQGKHGIFHTLLLSAESQNEESIKAIAGKVGLDVAKLFADMEAAATIKQIEENSRLAGELDIQGTPAFVLGNQVLPGAVDLESMVRLVAAERTLQQEMQKMKGQAKTVSGSAK